MHRDNNGWEGITMTMNPLRDTLNKRTEPLFLFTICALTTILIFTLMDLNSISPDETDYIYIGKSILNGEYPQNFMHRLPLIPSLFSLFFSGGFSVQTVRLLIPVIFMNSALITTYFFAKTLYTKKEAIIATSVLFSFPFFWAWGLNVLVDIPLITFSLLFLLFFYLGIEKEKKYLFISAIFLSLAFLLKLSAILLIPPAFLYLLITKRWKLMLTKEFILSAIFVPLFLIFVFAIFHALTSASISVSEESLFFAVKWDVIEALKLVLAPILLFGIFGISKRKEDVFVCLAALSFIIFFLWTGHLRLRYWSPILPLLAIFVASGYLRLRERFIFMEKKKIISLIFVILLLVTLVNANYLVSRDESACWGAEELSGYVNSLEGNIANEYRSLYLKASTNKSIVSIPSYVIIDKEKVETSKFYYDILVNKSHPKYSQCYEAMIQGKIIEVRDFDDKWIEDNNINYVILSIYGEFQRAPVTAYYHPKFGPFEITFINLPHSRSMPPPDYQFHSELYKRLGNSSKYKKVKEMYKGEQAIFVVYKVL
jgi:hypothetical protein